MTEQFLIWTRITWSTCLKCRFLGPTPALESECLDMGICIWSHSTNNLYVRAVTALTRKRYTWGHMLGLRSGVLPERVEHSLFCTLAERMDLQTHCLLVQDASILILVIAEKTSDSKQFSYSWLVGWPRTNFKNFKFWEFPGGPVVRTPCFHCRGHGFNPGLGN